jgi:hypothetical protein
MDWNWQDVDSFQVSCKLKIGNSMRAKIGKMTSASWSFSDYSPSFSIAIRRQHVIDLVDVEVFIEKAAVNFVVHCFGWLSSAVLWEWYEGSLGTKSQLFLGTLLSRKLGFTSVHAFPLRNCKIYFKNYVTLGWFHFNTQLQHSYTNTHLDSGVEIPH